MGHKIVINLTVINLIQTIQSYLEMGFFKNTQFLDGNAKYVVFTDKNFVMLLTHEKFTFNRGRWY